MDVSIIIVNYRGWKSLRKCLDSVSDFNGSLFEFEVIIVDNDSADGTIDEFKKNYPGFTFIINKVNGGFANGCNLGSTRATGDFFLFLNPDTIASEETIGKLLERAKTNPGNYIVSCRQVNEKKKESIAYGIFPVIGTLTGFGRTFFKLLKGGKFRGMAEREENVIYPDWVSGSVMMIKMEIFWTMAGFDEDYWMYYEDTDLCKRVREKQGSIAYYKDIEIQHDHGGSSRTNIITASVTKTEVSISRHVYISKHFTGGKSFLIQLYLVLNDLISGAFNAFFGLLFFAFPKIFVYVHIYRRLIEYYFGALNRRSWISPRSVNSYKK